MRFDFLYLAFRNCRCRVWYSLYPTPRKWHLLHLTQWTFPSGSWILPPFLGSAWEEGRGPAPTGLFPLLCSPGGCWLLSWGGQASPHHQWALPIAISLGKALFPPTGRIWRALMDVQLFLRVTLGCCCCSLCLWTQRSGVCPAQAEPVLAFLWGEGTFGVGARE